MNLPYISGEKGIGGKIREKQEYFIVEEIPAYLPSGQGKHLYINITKKGLSTPDVGQKICEIFNVSENDVGFAGLKDKHAITTQTLSINLENLKMPVEEILEKIKTIGVRVNSSNLHNNKLKPGHLKGNKFTITITSLEDIEKSFEIANQIAEKIKKFGIPNYYGAQRFGIQGDNAEKALAILKGELKIRDRFMKKFLFSSYQSHLCNLYLSKRVENGFNLIPGDICKKHDTGGLFVVENIEEEQKRYDNKEISFTAPMFGDRLWFAEKESGEIEKQILADSGLTEEQIKKLGTGTRRLGRLIIDDLTIEKEETGLKVSFSLPKGAFATVVLREFMKND